MEQILMLKILIYFYIGIPRIYNKIKRSKLNKKIVNLISLKTLKLSYYRLNLKKYGLIAWNAINKKR